MFPCPLARYCKPGLKAQPLSCMRPCGLDPALWTAGGRGCNVGSHSRARVLAPRRPNPVTWQGQGLGSFSADVLCEGILQAENLSPRNSTQQIPASALLTLRTGSPCVGDCPVCCRMCSSILGLTYRSQQHQLLKHVSGHGHVPSGDKSPLFENQYSVDLKREGTHVGPISCGPREERAGDVDPLPVCISHTWFDLCCHPSP